MYVQITNRCERQPPKNRGRSSVVLLIKDSLES